MRAFEDFAKLVRDSVEGQAKRKGYTDNDTGGDNKLAQITQILGIGDAHGIGEIIYKATEYLKNPREVLLIKIAGWCYILWTKHSS
jgi:hypothetical protein